MGKNMGLIENITKSIKNLLSKPSEELTRLQATVRYPLEMAWHCTREMYADRSAQMAAALTYHTLFSLLPTIVLMLVVAHTFVDETDMQKFKDTTVNWATQWLEQSSSEAPDMQTDFEPTDDRSQEFARTTAALEKEIQGKLDELESVSFSSIGVVGVLLFIYCATALLATVERSFNLIYGAPSSRSWYMRLPLYYTVITLAPLVLLAGQLLQARIDSVMTGAGFTWLATLLMMFSPLIATWIVLFLLYVLLPNTPVRLRPALTGSLVAAVGWVTVIWLFGIYVGNAVQGSLYGSLALLPLALLWLWLSWWIVLFGLEITYTLQAMSHRTFKSLVRSDDRDLFIDPHWLIPMMGLIAQRFDKGKSITPQQLSRKLDLPIRAVTKLAEHLTGAGLINRIDDGETEEPGYALALPPDRISVEQMLNAGQQLSLSRGQHTKLPGFDLIAQLTSAQHSATQGATLANMLKRTST